MLAVVVQVDGFDPVAGVPVTLRAGSHDDAAVCHLDGLTWWPALTKLPTLRYDLFDGAFGGQITAPSSSLTLSAEPWPQFGRYALVDARFRLWTGQAGQPWSSWTLRFDGRVSEQPELEDGQASLSFAVDDRWLDGSLLPTYAGTTGAEGTADLKGQPKPLALGAPRYVAGTLVDPVTSMFQVSAGPVLAIEAALEKLARFGAPIADYPSYAALDAATIPAGRWATAKAAGFARLGAPPTGQVSFLVSGDSGGPNGWARKPGQLVRRIALLSGGTGKVHDASLDALDIVRPYNLSLYLDQQLVARQQIQQLAASVNAVAGMSWTGKLFAVPVAIGAPMLTLSADGSSLPPVTKVKQVGIAAPFRKLAIGAERAWTVHALADIAFTATLVDRGGYIAGETYREGNLVQAGGSTWLYINPAATSGNSPPALPTEEDAYWRVLARAGTDGQDGADGAQGPAGQNGANGLNGTNGAPGPAGADGVSAFIHVAYGDSADGSVDFTTGAPGARRYIGIHKGTTEADPTDYQVYTWSRLTGTNGLNGADGTQGSPGADGQTSYVHFAYANSADGATDFSVADPVGRAFIGIYSDFIQADSLNPAAYTWSLAKGADGAPGAPGQRGDDGLSGAQGAAGANGLTSYTHYAYANSPDGVVDFTTADPQGRAYEGVYSDFAPADSGNPAAYTWKQYYGPRFGMASRGTAVVAGASVIKNGGDGGWNADAYSTAGYKNGCYASFRLVATGEVMAGFNTDPTADSSYTSLDCGIL